MEMARLSTGKLREAWAGEATHFTPLLAQQLDALGAVIDVDLASIGESEVDSAGGRRIDIVASGADGSEFVVENQYGRADHDHLTRGLAYAVARRARGLVVVAEEHRDEFRAVAEYLNDLAELDPERGIAVWLVEVRAVRIADSPWAPMFSAVVKPNEFTGTVERAKQAEPRITSDEELFAQCAPEVRPAVQSVLSRWVNAGHRRYLGRDHAVLAAKGPAKGWGRSVVTIYTDGRVMVPFSAYAGLNSGIPIHALMTEEFRQRANSLFGFDGSIGQARTSPGWLSAATEEHLVNFCQEVVDAYAAALLETG